MKPLNGHRAKAMSGAILRTALYCLGAIVLAAAIATGLDIHLKFDSPLGAQLINAALPVGLMLVAGALFGRLWAALGAELVLLLVLGYADQLKTDLLDTNLVYADLQVVPSLLMNPGLIVGFLHSSWLKAVVLVVAVLISAALIYGLRRRGRMRARLRWAFLVLALMLAGGLSLYRPEAIVPQLHWSVYGQASGADQVGTMGNILLGALTTSDTRHPADAKAVKAFWQEPAVRRAIAAIHAHANAVRPDIVIVQSESLFLPSQLCGLSDTPWLTHIGGSGVSHLQVPVFGGRTLQTEFEVQTGAPTAFFPGSMFAYYEQLGHPVDAFAHALDQLGYQTTFLHPNNRGFWRRNTAIPNMGFDTFQDKGSFLPSEYSSRGHISDMVLTRAVLAELDGADRPAYVTAVTMDNHGPWGAYAPAGEEATLPPALTGEGRQELGDYLARAKDADNAFGFLTDALSRRARPTVVAIYGDHLPALEPVYAQLCFKDGKPAPEHDPPLRLWANFAIQPPPAQLPAYLLGGWLARASHLAVSGPVLADAAMEAILEDASVPVAERGRILAEYDNVAASNLQTAVASRGAQEQVFAGSASALDILQKYRPRTGAPLKMMDGDVLLTDSSANATVAFGIDQRVSSLSLRPYVQCLAGAPEKVGDFMVTADGRAVYDAAVGPQMLRLATLDLRGVKNLQWHMNLAGFPGECIALVHVAQLEQCTAHCGTVPRHAEPRLIQHDFMAGDIAALPGYGVTAQQDTTPVPIANLEWLLTRAKAHRDGMVPIAMQGDGQLFMHPAETHDAWMEFDTAGIDSIDFTPRINTLDATCRGIGDTAGVVGLSLLVDGKPLVSNMRIDRFYKQSLHVPLASSRTLRISVSKGNGVTACDWFSIGVAHIGLPSGATQAP